MSWEESESRESEERRGREKKKRRSERVRKYSEIYRGEERGRENRETGRL